LLHLANEPSKPLIVHCTAGKDRTGVICALILSLCGVEDEIVAQEYALTDRGLSMKWKESVIEHMMTNPALKGNLKGAWNMIGAKYVAFPSCTSYTNEVISELKACS
jgi:protein tyrosine/serine phosphatase